MLTGNNGSSTSSNPKAAGTEAVGIAVVERTGAPLMPEEKR